MIDRKLVLSDKEYIKRELSKKDFDTRLVDELFVVLTEVRSLKAELNKLYKRRNEVSRDISVSAEDKRGIRADISFTEKKLSELEDEAKNILLVIPNLPDPSAPTGSDESKNVVICQSSEYYECETEHPLPHWDIAGRLGILDKELAGKIASSGFVMYKGKGAKLLRALVDYCMAMHEEEYTEILPPHVANTQSLICTGHLPKFSDEQYKCSRDDLWLIPTAEVPLTAALAQTVFPGETLPQRYMGYTLSFRREAGSSGKGTRGLQRIHEFHKVELLKVAKPQFVQKELNNLLEDCLRIIKDLRLQYRVVDICCGEMGDKYARCYDIEVYSPGMRKWLEVSSVGHFSDYQARRAGIKFTDENGRKKLAYTLNGSGVATPRVWAAIVETYQQPDGSVRVTEVLTPFMGCELITNPCVHTS